MGDGKFSLIGGAVPPYPPVYAGEEVVDIDAHVGVDFTLEEDPDVQDGHNYPHGPEPFAGLVLQVDVN